MGNSLVAVTFFEIKPGPCQGIFDMMNDSK
jgi:hypothetical protein